MNSNYLEFHDTFIFCCLPFKQTLDAFSNGVSHVFRDILLQM